jgi:transcriptional regulator with XRE-family HTH domain
MPPYFLGALSTPPVAVGQDYYSFCNYSRGEDPGPAPDELRPARQTARLTQQQAAARPGVSQPYLALMERGQRPVTARFWPKIVKLYGLGPAAMPLETGCLDSWNSASLATALASLGYPRFRHLRGGRGNSPAVVLLAAVAASDVEVRLAEALPWLLVEYSDLDWDWLIRESKSRDVRNRLGFLVTLARQVAVKWGDEIVDCGLRQVETARTAFVRSARTLFAKPPSRTQSVAGSGERVLRTPATGIW